MLAAIQIEIFWVSLWYLKTTINIYKIKILAIILYGCETWSLTLGEEHRLRVFENRVLRGIFVLMRERN
jgi:hypothetical protein